MARGEGVGVCLAEVVEASRAKMQEMLQRKYAEGGGLEGEEVVPWVR